jgi:glycosyltransferase involved in cell wall biosynthesis
MKILLSAAGQLDGRIGGGQVYVQRLARELDRRGHDLVVVSAESWAEGPGAYQIAWRTWNGIRVAGVSVNPASARPGDHWSDRSKPLCTAIGAIVDEVRPDLIHLNGMKPAVVTVALERSIPHVVTAHHAGVACPAGTLLRPDESLCHRAMHTADCAACYCRLLRGGNAMGRALAAVPPAIHVPLGRVLNRVPNPTYAGRALMYPWLVGRAIEGKRHAILHAARWIAPSRAIMELLVRNGTPPERISVIPHGIDPLRPTRIEGLGRRPIRFGYAGRIDRIKGLHVLFEAFGRLPRGAAELHIAGSPQRDGERAYLAAAMATCPGRAGIRLHGTVPQEQLDRFYHDIDVLVLPTICLEVFGLVVLEAFSAGRPVIVSDCGGPADIVRDGVDGLVVARNDVSALERSMRQLVGDPDRILALAERIRLVRTLAEHVSDVETVYDDVRGNRPLVPTGV